MSDLVDPPETPGQRQAEAVERHLLSLVGRRYATQVDLVPTAFGHLGRQDYVTDAEAVYLRYKIDESAAEVTRSYWLDHHHDNLEIQSIYVHDMTESARKAERHGVPSDRSATAETPTWEDAP